MKRAHHLEEVCGTFEMENLNPDSTPVAAEPDEVDELTNTNDLGLCEGATEVSEDARSTEERETSQTSPPRLPEHIESLMGGSWWRGWPK